MPEQYRALVVVLLLSGLVFAFIKSPATAIAIRTEDFVRRRNCWLLITIAGFVSPNFWVCMFVVAFVCWRTAKQESNKIALFFFLLLALPQLREEIPTFGLIGNFFSMDYVRLLTLFILLPICVELFKNRRKSETGILLPDLLLILYSVLNTVLTLTGFGVNTFLRAVPTWTIDVLIPYYAISRSVKDIKSFRDVFMSFAVAAMLASAVGVFEFQKKWLLYSSLDRAWGVDSLTIYVLRADLLRAVSTSGIAIVFGYIVAIAVGFYLFLKHSIPSKFYWYGGLAILAGGVISPLSKGPWLGLAVMVLVFLALSPQRFMYATKVFFVCPVIAIFLVSTDVGTQIMGFLPFVGTVDEGSAAYRQLLFDISIRIILDNPFFGSTDYILRMEELRQGQGIIDLVNTFLIVALRSGLVGLSLYVGFFICIIWNIFTSSRQVKATPELLDLGNSMLAVILGILVIIATVSPISHVVIGYMSVTSLGLAYHLMLKKHVGLRKAIPSRPRATTAP